MKMKIAMALIVVGASHVVQAEGLPVAGRSVGSRVAEEEVNILVTLTPPEDFPVEELESLTEAIEEECRFSGAFNVTVEVQA